jgi:hypothetical protein
MTTADESLARKKLSERTNSSNASKKVEQPMLKSIISAVLFAALCVCGAANAAVTLVDNPPEQYTVVKGDTLWAIAGKFLKEPWRWPEIWDLNRDQIRNPHWIYPGDVVALDRSGADPRLRLVRGPQYDRLSPRLRIEELNAHAIPTVPAAVIEPFLSRPLVVPSTTLDDAPRVVAGDENRVMMGNGSRAFARGLTPEQGGIFHAYRPGAPIVDPETGDYLGYGANYLGEAKVIEFGEISTLEITSVKREIGIGDRLLPAGQPMPYAYTPHAPATRVDGRIISAYSNLREMGQNSIVLLNRGTRDGLDEGTVLGIYRDPAVRRRIMRTGGPVWGTPAELETTQSAWRGPPYWGDPGPAQELTALQNNPMAQTAPLPGPRAAAARPIINENSPLNKLPKERYGLLFVFRVFERVSFALVLESSRPVEVLDSIRNP